MLCFSCKLNIKNLNRSKSTLEVHTFNFYKVEEIQDSL